MLKKDRETGAAAVFIAVTMLVILGFLAIAVDLGFGFNERRVDQTSADSAALGGSLEMVITNQANPVQAAIDEVYALVNTNLGRTIPQADWTNCSDPNALFWRTLADSGMLGTTNGSDCISISTDFNTFRVRVPGQETETIFAIFIGSDSLTTSAAAEAERNTDWGGGGDFPTAVYSSQNAGDTFCIKTGASGSEDCDGSATGNWGFFRPYFYSAVDDDLSTLCVTGEQPFSIPRAMADGIDHEFSGWFPTSGPERINGQWCMTSGVPGPPFPNTIRLTSGYSNQDVTRGLITGGPWPTTYAGRLDRGPYQDPNTIIFGRTIDNRPLWDFIDDSVTYMGLSAPCETAKNRPRFVLQADLAAARAEMAACLSGAMSATPIPRIFTTEINSSQRLGHSPLLYEGGPCGMASCNYHIVGIVPIFIDGIWAATSPHLNCLGEFNNTGTACIAHAGVQGEMQVSAPGQQRVHSGTAVLLDCALMPTGTCPSIQDGTGPINFLYDLQLTK